MSDDDYEDEELNNRICDILVESAEYKVSEYAESLMKRYDLTREDVDDVLETIDDIDLDRMLVQMFPVFCNKRWALKLFHYKLKLMYDEVGDFGYFD